MLLCNDLSTVEHIRQPTSPVLKVGSISQRGGSVVKTFPAHSKLNFHSKLNPQTKDTCYLNAEIKTKICSFSL